MKKKFWFFIHNAIAHPLLCTGFGWADTLHDYTADKMDAASEMPVFEPGLQSPVFYEVREMSNREIMVDLTQELAVKIRDAVYDIKESEIRATMLLNFGNNKKTGPECPVLVNEDQSTIGMVVSVLEHYIEQTKSITKKQSHNP